MERTFFVGAMLSNLRSRAAISLAALLITSLVLNGIIINVPVKAQAQPGGGEVGGSGTGTVKFNAYAPTSTPPQCTPETSTPDTGRITFGATLNTDGTVDTTVPSTDRNFDLGVIGFGSGLASGTITGGAVSGGGVSGSSFSLTGTYSDCGEVKTATITGTCGTNQQITLTSTGGASFAGTGDVTCFFRPTQTTITSAIDGNGNPVQNGGSTNSRSITFQVTATAGTSPIAGFKCNLDGGAFDTCATTNPATISYPPGILQLDSIRLK